MISKRDEKMVLAVAKLLNIQNQSTILVTCNSYPHCQGIGVFVEDGESNSGAGATRTAT
jgi:hypothetical protein